MEEISILGYGLSQLAAFQTEGSFVP